MAPELRFVSFFFLTGNNCYTIFIKSYNDFQRVSCSVNLFFFFLYYYARELLLNFWIWWFELSALSSKCLIFNNLLLFMIQANKDGQKIWLHASVFLEKIWKLWPLYNKIFCLFLAQFNVLIISSVLLVALFPILHKY